MHPHSFHCRLIIITSVLCSYLQVAVAQENYSNTDGQDYETPANWSGGVVPDQDDHIRVAVDGATATAVLDGASRSVFRVEVGLGAAAGGTEPANGTLTLQNGAIFTVTNENGAFLPDFQNTDYIGSWGGIGTLNLLGGSEYHGNELRVAHYAGSKGFLNLNGNSKLSLNHLLFISTGGDSEGTLIVDSSQITSASAGLRVGFGMAGPNSTGRFELLNGSTATFDSIEAGMGFGATAGLEGTIIVDASTLSVNGSILAAHSVATNRCDLIFRNGSTINAGVLHIGGPAAGDGIGTLSLTGDTTSLTTTSSLIVYNEADATTITQTDGDITLGTDLSVHGIYELSGSTANLTVGHQIILGHSARGELHISDGAQIDTGTAGFIVGAQNGGDGYVSLTEGTLNMPQAHLWVGEQPGSKGRFEQLGGEVAIADRIWIGVYAGADGEYHQNGGSLHTPIIQIGDTGRFVLDEGTLKVGFIETYTSGQFIWNGGRVVPDDQTLIIPTHHTSSADCTYAIEAAGQSFHFGGGVDLSAGGTLEIYEITGDTSSGIVSGKMTLMEAPDLVGLVDRPDVPFDQLTISTPTHAQLISYNEAQARSNWSPFSENRYWIQFIDDPSGNDKLILHYSLAPDTRPSVAPISTEGGTYPAAWTILYPGASALDPAVDTDGDGETNLVESQHGTDPFDAASYSGFTHFQLSEDGETFEFGIHSSPYAVYRLWQSDSTAEDAVWTDTGVDVVGTGGIVAHSQPAASFLIDAALPDKQFFRLQGRALDSDGDNLSDLDEVAYGYDRYSPVTYSIGDYEDMMARLGSQPDFSISTVRDYCTEGDTTGLIFEVTRGGSLEATTASYSYSGTATSGADFSPGTQQIAFAFGERSKTFSIVPTADGADEFAETLVVTLQPSADYTIGDASAQGIIEDSAATVSRASLRASGVPYSAGYGLATVEIAGNGLTIKISTDIDNLTSPQTGAALLIPDGLGGTVAVLSLPIGDLQEHEWVVADSGGLTAAEIVAAVRAEQAELIVYSENYPTGEIRGTILVNGQTDTIPTPDTPPALPSGSITAADAVRFSEQVSFGATPAQIADIQARGYEGWIDHQMSLHTSDFVQDHYNLTLDQNPGFPNHLHLRKPAFFKTVMTGDDQLRLRVAWALSQIFVVSEIGTDTSGMLYGLSKYKDVLATNAFGNFRDLLEAVTRNPAMALYLSMYHAKKPDLENDVFPDENFAREVMQLFTVGLDMLHLDGTPKLDANGERIPTYTPEDVSELARTLTGWAFAPIPADYEFPEDQQQNLYYWRNRMDPLIGDDTQHDLGEKTIIGGVVIPAGGTTLGDTGLALDTLYNHPNVGPFISKQLIQRLVTSNPSPGYVYRVASIFNDNGSGVRGDMGAVVKAILLDYEARAPEMTSVRAFGHLKEPILKSTQVFRRFGINMADAANFNYEHFLDLNVQIWMLDTHQFPYQSPSVFNFYRPDYAHPGPIKDGNYVSPEFQLQNATSTAQMANLYYYSLGRMDFSELIPLADTPAELVDFLNEQLLANQLSTELRDDMVAFLESLTTSAWNGSTRTEAELYEERAWIALHLFTLQPEFAVSK